MNIVKPFLIAGLFGAGCATAVPPDKISAADSSIRAAEELGAPKVPQASLYLQMAKEETGQAEKLIKDGDPKRAEGILSRAQADAELAVAEAREAPLRAEAQQEMERARALMQKR
jgi:Domain of unknown function (DUF4398)